MCVLQENTVLPFACEYTTFTFIFHRCYLHCQKSFERGWEKNISKLGKSYHVVEISRKMCGLLRLCGEYPLPWRTSLASSQITLGISIQPQAFYSRYRSIVIRLRSVTRAIYRRKGLFVGLQFQKVRVHGYHREHGFRLAGRHGARAVPESSHL